MIKHLLIFLPHLLNLDRVRWTVLLHMQCMHCPEGIFNGSNLILHSTYSVQRFSRILIFLSRNQDSVICVLSGQKYSYLRIPCMEYVWVGAQIEAIKCTFQNILVYSLIRVRFWRWPNLWLCRYGSSLQLKPSFVQIRTLVVEIWHISCIWCNWW